MKRTLLALGLGLSLGLSAGSFAQAKTPPEVLEPYKAYRKALEAKHIEDAANHAFQAWEQAEDLMGDTVTTGDLAINFAELRPRFVNNKQAWKNVMKAHKRAIDLASLHKDDPTGVEIDRRTKYLAWLISTLPSNAPGARDKGYSAKRLNERIEELGLKGSTFDAESMAFVAQTSMLKKDWKATQRESIAAMKMFDVRTDGIFSVYEFAVPIYLARAYAEQDKTIDSALTYQALMTKMEQRGGHDNPISSDAYGEWLRLRDEVVESKSEDPRAIQVVNFTVPVGRQKELSPLIRKPPAFPSSFLRGNKSGYVKVKFNVDLNGHVLDPVIISSTDKRLHRHSLASLEEWRYSPNLPKASSRDIEVTIRFDLQGPSGKRFKYGDEIPRL